MAQWPAPEGSPALRYVPADSGEFPAGAAARRVVMAAAKSGHGGGGGGRRGFGYAAAILSSSRTDPSRAAAISRPAADAASVSTSVSPCTSAR